MYFYCEKCKKQYPIEGHDWHCGECGGLFRLHKKPTEKFREGISIGEGVTPLLPFRVNDRDFLLKMESMQPTGSFKDRGAKRLINEIAPLGVEKIALDSAGNAGAALAAYAAQAGIDCTVYVPDDAAHDKI